MRVPTNSKKCNRFIYAEQKKVFSKFKMIAIVMQKIKLTSPLRNLNNRRNQYPSRHRLRAVITDLKSDKK
jgi:hypothetical protein